MLLTFWRAGWIAFVTIILRALIFFGGYGALNGKVEGNRTWLGGHGLYREVPPWLYYILLGYEIGACIGLLAAMVAITVFKRRTGNRPLF